MNSTANRISDSKPQVPEAVSHAPKAETSRARPKIVVRNPRFSFDDVPKHWVLGSGALTHLSNGLNVLFPMGERFFVRSVRHYEEQITDPVLREEIRAFYAQEGRHAGAHEKQIETLRAQGFGLERFFRVYQTLAYDIIERFSPPMLRLSATAALEHFTAILAEGSLSTNDLDGLPEEMQKLLGWHSVEELEHKAVAFDVLREVSGGSYAVRMAGLAFALTTFTGFWMFATSELCRADGISFVELVREVKKSRDDRRTLREMLVKGTRAYLKRDFHPLDHDTRHLVQAFLEKWKMAA